jgi:hypothetical protein
MVEALFDSNSADFLRKSSATARSTSFKLFRSVGAGVEGVAVLSAAVVPDVRSLRGVFRGVVRDLDRGVVRRGGVIHSTVLSNSSTLFFST